MRLPQLAIRMTMTITCGECKHFVEGNKCALTMARKPLGTVRSDQRCDDAVECVECDLEAFIAERVAASPGFAEKVDEAGAKSFNIDIKIAGKCAGDECISDDDDAIMFVEDDVETVDPIELVRPLKSSDSVE